MRELQMDTLIRVVEAEGYPQHATEYDERAWRLQGRFAEIIAWDTGYGNCYVIKAIPKPGHEWWMQDFFDRIDAAATEDEEEERRSWDDDEDDEGEGE